jgi:hypothetical protein
MFVEMEIPFHEFTYFSYISIREMKMKQNTLDPKTELGDFLNVKLEALCQSYQSTTLETRFVPSQ